MRVGLALLLLLLLGVTLASCAGKFLSSGSGSEARYRHRELGYEIAYPSVLSQPGWQAASLDESDLLVRHPDGSAWALASNCRATKAPVRVLAAELARATGGTARVEGGPIEHAGLAGWSQRLERIEKGRRLELKTVTLRSDRCTYDWILIAPDATRLAALEPPFDRWWQSFEPGPADRETARAAEGAR